MAENIGTPTKGASVDEEVVQDAQQELIEPEQHLEASAEHAATEAERQDDPVDLPKENLQDKNWRKARQIMEEQKRQIDYLQQQVDHMRSPRQESAEEEQISDQDFVQGRHLNRRLAELENKLRVKEADIALDRLRSKYPDFDEVVSAENVQLLKQNDPELAVSLQALQSDPHAQALAAYKMLKRTDYSQQKTQSYDRERIRTNQSKPTSVQAVRRGGALAEANKFVNGLTPELKDSLWKEMQEACKRAY